MLGGALLLLYVPLIVKPGKTRELMLAFPRNKPAAWILAAVALFWSWCLVDDIHLGRLESVKRWLPIIAVVGYVLIVFFMDELLAPRALGGVLLLIPAPILSAARLNDSPLRHIVSIIAYIMVVKGITLVLSPFLFRKWLLRFLPDKSRCRILGAIGAGISAVLIVLGLTVY